MIANLNAVAAPFDITAAMASKAMLSVRSLMHAAAIEPKGRMSVREVDAALQGSRLSSTQRIELKLAMDRAGLLTED
jgi:hypothetical protein